MDITFHAQVAQPKFYISLYKYIINYVYISKNNKYLHDDVTIQMNEKKKEKEKISTVEKKLV